MNAFRPDRVGALDLVRQLHRRWLIVLGAAALGLIVALAIDEVLLLATVSTAGRLLVLVAGAVVGAIVGFGVALVIVRLHPLVTTVEDVRRLTGLPVVGQLPSATLDADDFDPGETGDKGVQQRLRSALRETVMNTRALSGGRMPARIVVARSESLTGAAGVDGGLARALVETGHVTAVVHTDFDSRLLVRPSTMEETPVGQPLRADGAGYQHITVPDRVASSVRPDRLAAVDEFLDTLAERYDVTVSQVASNSLPLDVRSVTPVADAVLLVVASNRTTVETLLSLQAELLSLEVRPLGVILTSVAPRHVRLLRRTWVPSDVRSLMTSAPASTMAVATSVGATGPSAAQGSTLAGAGGLEAQADPAPASFDDEFDEPAPRRSGFSIADLAAQHAKNSHDGEDDA